MKFGKRLLEQRHQPWAARYVPYDELKQIVKQIVPALSPVTTKAEGDFLSLLLGVTPPADTAPPPVMLFARSS